MQRLTGSVVALVIALVGTSHNAGAQTSGYDPECFAVRTAPPLFSAEVVGPQTLDPGDVEPFGWNPAFGRLTRGAVHYISANYVRVKLVSDRCSIVGSVAFGSRIVTTTNADGFYYFTQTQQVPGYPNRVAHSVSVHFPYGREGSTDTVKITLGRAVRLAGTIDYSFPLVRVNRVEAVDVSAPIGFSQAEVFNMFGKSLYEQFGRSANSAVITLPNGDPVRIYGYDPDSLFVTIDSRGVSFGFRFRIDKPCQPRAQVQGRFRLNATRGSPVSLVWVVEPYTNLEWPPICEIAQGIPGLGDIVHWIFFSGAEGQVSAGVAGRIEQAVQDSMSAFGPASGFFDGSSTRPGELLVNLKLPVASIRIQVPYDAFDMNRSGTAFPPDSAFAILASDLAPADYIGGVPPAVLRSGPNGVPRLGTTDWPNAQTLLRWQPPIWSGAPVGRLLARRSDPQRTLTYQYTPACSIDPESWFAAPVSIRFGVNDTAADAERLRPAWAHGYWLRIFFFDFGEGTRCQERSSDPIVLPPMPGA
jgi:hypothetical protein